jgi:hypothetical protein
VWRGSLARASGFQPCRASDSSWRGGVSAKAGQAGERQKGREVAATGSDWLPGAFGAPHLRKTKSLREYPSWCFPGVALVLRGAQETLGTTVGIPGGPGEVEA